MKFQNFICVIVGAACWLSSAHAQELHPGPQQQAASQALLPQKGEDPGLLLSRFDGELTVSAACSDCPQSGALRLAIPQLARELPLRASELVLENGTRLGWIRLGDDALHYSWLLRIGPLPERAPHLVFKGWTRPQGPGLRVERRRSGNRLFVLGAEKPAACGRSVAAWAKRFDERALRFRRAHLSVLGPEPEPVASLLFEPEVATSARVLLRLQAAGELSAQAPVDGDRGAAWKGAHELVELQTEQGRAPREIVVQLSKTLGQERSLYLIAGDKVLMATLLPGTLQQRLVVPDEFAAGCLTLLQPRVPLPISEIMSVVQTDSPVTLTSLVQALQAPDGGWSQAALALRGQEAGDALSKVYAKLSPVGKLRARNLASQLPGRAGAQLQIEVFRGAPEDGQARALADLRRRGSISIGPLAQALRGPVSEADQPLVELLYSLDAHTGRQLAYYLLGSDDRAARNLGRWLVQADVDGGEGEGALLAALTRTNPELSSLAKVELLGSLFGASVHENPDARDSLTRACEDLSTDASFEEAYLLADVAVELSAGSEQLRRQVLGWLDSVPAGKVGTSENAALSVRVAEAIAQRPEHAKYLVGYPVLQPLLHSDNVRVRKAALALVSLVPTRYEETLRQRLQREDWPLVRKEAARALGNWATKAAPTDPQLQELARLLVRRLRSDDNEWVRRALARAAGTMPREAVSKALRRAFHRDRSVAVRAEAAVSLGKICDLVSLDPLTARALGLAQGPLDEDRLALGLAAVAGLAYLGPVDLKVRLEPLFSVDLPAVLRRRIQNRLSVSGSDGIGCGP